MENSSQMQSGEDMIMEEGLEEISRAGFEDGGRGATAKAASSSWKQQGNRFPAGASRGE